MTFLLLAIVCSSIIGLLFKYSENNGFRRYVITAVNYFTASVVGLLLVFKDGVFSNFHFVSMETFFFELQTVVNDNGGILSPGSSAVWSVFVGVFTGVFYLNAFIFYQKSIHENGIALSSMFSRLGVLIPVCVSMVLWNELPTVIQVAGIALALLSIVLVTFNNNSTGSESIKISLLWLFLLTGVGLFCNKLFQKYAILRFRGLFLFVVFFTALLLSLYFLWWKKQRGTRVDCVIGIGVGVFNLLTNFFLIMSLSVLKASVIFPVFSAGAIVLMTLGGVLLFGEKIRKKDVVAIGLTIVAIVVINA